MREAAHWFAEVATALKRLEDYPYGPTAAEYHVPDTPKVAGQACVQLCGGDQDKGRELWKAVCHQLGVTPRDMPAAAAVALIVASRAENLVPDIEAPVPA